MAKLYASLIKFNIDMDKSAHYYNFQFTLQELLPLLLEVFQREGACRSYDHQLR